MYPFTRNYEQSLISKNSYVKYTTNHWLRTYCIRQYNQNDLKCLQRTQNYAARVVVGEFDYINVGGVDLLKHLEWMTIFPRYHYFCLLLMFKCIHGQAPDYLCNNIIMELLLRSEYAALWQRIWPCMGVNSKNPAMSTIGLTDAK